MISLAGHIRKDNTYARFLALKKRLPKADVKKINKLFTQLDQYQRDLSIPKQYCTNIMDQIDVELEQMDKPLNDMTTF